MRNEDVNVLFSMRPWKIRRELWSPEAQATARRLGFNVRLNTREGPPTPADWADMFEGVEAMITCWGTPRLDHNVLARNNTLRIVGHAAGSVAEIVSPELYARGVRVVTANTVMAQTVAEWCLMVTLVGWTRFLDYFGRPGVRYMTWDDRWQARGIQNATVAIWGYGDISRRLVQLLHEMGPKEILVSSNHLTPDEAAAAGVTLVAFDELFARGDIIHLLGGMTDRNRGRVGATHLAAIRNDALLINAGRANLVQEDALLAELRKGRFMAVLDVHYREPLPDDSPFRDLPNVVLTPHLGARGRDGLYVGHVLEEFDRFFRGEPLTSEVSLDRADTMSGGSGWGKDKPPA